MGEKKKEMKEKTIPSCGSRGRKLMLSRQPSQRLLLRLRPMRDVAPKAPTDNVALVADEHMPPAGSADGEECCVLSASNRSRTKIRSAWRRAPLM